MSTYSIGISALATARAGLLATEHNISNVSTAGFHRQQIVQSPNLAQYTGNGFFGQGVHVDTVKRSYDQLLEGQVLQAQTQSSQLESYYAQVKQLDNMLADPSSGVSPALQEFFNGVHDVAVNPASVPSRQAMLSGAQIMVDRFQAINQRFTEIRDGVNGEVTSSIQTVNAYATQIASLNQQIGVSLGAASGQQPPNDLLDQRDQLIADLNKIIKVSTVKQDDGSLNVFIGNGQTLVLGAQSFTMGAAPSRDDPERIDVGMSFGGSTILLPKGILTGGSLGGLLAFRDETLDPAQNALGRTAIGLAQTFNDQHKLGMDMNGALGADFFSVAAPKIINNTGNSTNITGSSPSVAITDVSALTTSDYKLSYSASGYSLTRLSDNKAMLSPSIVAAAGAQIGVFDGLTITAPTTAPANGDSWLIKPTINGARDIAVKLTDTAKVAAAAPIKTGSTLSNIGSGKISAGTVNSFNDKVTLTFNAAGTAFTAVDTTTGATLATDVAYAAGNNIDYNGWRVAIAGVPGNGDVFTIDHAVASTSSLTATIGNATLLSPPVDPNLTNDVQIIFGSSNTYHLAGTTNNITGQSTIAGTNAFMPAAGVFDGYVTAGGSHPDFTGVATGTTTIGTPASYSATNTTTTISGGIISGAVGGPYTITGATLTVGGGTSANTTTVRGLTITVDTVANQVTFTPPATGSYVASTFTYTGNPATGSYAAGQPISFNGWTTKITGTPATGDKFTVGTNAGGVSDNRNALLLAGLQTQNTLAGGTTSYQGAYSQLVSLVGNKTHEVEVTAKAQANLVSQTQQAQQAVSGVNLDEEAANLLRYQQAYQAAGKMMQIAGTLFDTLLGLK